MPAAALQVKPNPLGGVNDATRWRVVRTGSWLYAGSAVAGVWVVEADYDPWFEVAKADGRLEPGEAPLLNAAGHSYCAVLKRAPVPGEPFWPDTDSCLSVADACTAAQAKVPTPITWK